MELDNGELITAPDINARELIKVQSVQENVGGGGPFNFNHTLSSFYILPTTENEVLEVIRGKDVASEGKAFDLVNHRILLLKLKAAGVRGVALSWFRTYLAGRQHEFAVVVERGVPQGSVTSASFF
ncbi:hypothetical protein J6590_007158 [Homalodisca vitripennis]|nr:hypothetical protein J6590_007158 [Homalodisca vitripennis]